MIEEAAIVDEAVQISSHKPCSVIVFQREQCAADLHIVSFATLDTPVGISIFFSHTFRKRVVTTFRPFPHSAPHQWAIEQLCRVACIWYILFDSTFA